MTVAGSDSGGGAGIQADLKTYQARGVFGTSAISALTAQNTRGVRGVHTVPTQHLSDQMEAVLSDIGADVVKTGMLPTPEVILLSSSLCFDLVLLLVSYPLCNPLCDILQEAVLKSPSLACCLSRGQLLPSSQCLTVALLLLSPVVSSLLPFCLLKVQMACADSTSMTDTAVRYQKAAERDLMLLQHHAL